MKATGVVRRMDELGRVVIPKEVRRSFRIKEGTPLEVFTNRNGEIILKKYAPVKEIEAFAGEYVAALHAGLSMPALICDLDVYIAAAGETEDVYLGKDIHDVVRTAMHSDKSTRSIVNGHCILATKDEKIHSYAITPIIANEEVIGAIVVFSKDTEITQIELSSMEIAASFIGSQLTL